MAVVLGPTGISISSYESTDSSVLDDEQSLAFNRIQVSNNIHFLTGHAGSFQEKTLLESANSTAKKVVLALFTVRVSAPFRVRDRTCLRSCNTVCRRVSPRKPSALFCKLRYWKNCRRQEAHSSRWWNSFQKHCRYVSRHFSCFKRI